MNISKVVSGPVATNCYILEKDGVFLIIDPAYGSFATIEKYIRDGTVCGVLLTHSHWDHIGALAAVENRWHPRIYVHPLDKKNVEHPGSDQIPCPEIEPSRATDLISDNQLLSIGPFSCIVWHTPGHSHGSCCFLFEDAIFTGDTLFRGTYGRVDLPTSDPVAMGLSLRRLQKLPTGVELYPGHGPTTTVEKEAWLFKENFFE